MRGSRERCSYNDAVDLRGDLREVEFIQAYAANTETYTIKLSHHAHLIDSNPGAKEQGEMLMVIRTSHSRPDNNPKERR